MSKGDKLTPQQEKLLGFLLDGVKWREALLQAGYKGGTGRSDILKSAIFRQEISSHMENMIAINGPAAVIAMENALDNPTEAGTRERVKVATEFLDRMGLGKVDRVKVEEGSASAIFVLPAKKSVTPTEDSDAS